jgi:3-hydroxyacyl-CoA dehydrogenase
MPPAMKPYFSITHFFNPPRYMRLLELVGGADSNPEMMQTLATFCDQVLGKSVVVCNDTPGFIANRLGIFWMQSAVVHAVRMGLTVEEADAVLGKPFGIPKTGVFGLLDLVGLDLMPHVTHSMGSLLAQDDPFHALNEDVPVVAQLIADGYTGRKGKGGFYRLNKADGQKVKESVDLQSGVFSKSVKASLDSVRANKKSPKGLMEHSDLGGQYAMAVMLDTLSYAAYLLPDVSDDVAAIDMAMMRGYNWAFGPFQLLDKIGADWFVAQLQKLGRDVPPILAVAAQKMATEGTGFYRVVDGHQDVLQMDGRYKTIVRPAGVLLLEDIKRGGRPILKNGSAAVWDIGDGVVCFEFTGKMNSLDQAVLALLGKTIALVEKHFKAMVIYNEGTNFSAGANLGLALFAANVGLFSEIEKLVRGGQDVYQKLRYAPFPVVAAPSGLALGGGCEILLHSDAVQAHAETYTGLVECGVGIIPGWGGCVEMLRRWQENPKHPNGAMAVAGKVFETLSTATVAKSAEEAKSHLFIPADSGITMNRDRLLFDAKAKALALAEAYQPPEKPVFHLQGESAQVAFKMAVDSFRAVGKATPYDSVVARELAYVLSGGDTDVTREMQADEVLALEVESFMRLVRDERTLARMESILETGKPLRN